MNDAAQVHRHGDPAKRVPIAQAHMAGVLPGLFANPGPSSSAAELICIDSGLRTIPTLRLVLIKADCPILHGMGRKSPRCPSRSGTLKIPA